MYILINRMFTKLIDKTTWCGVHLLKSHMNHFVQTTKLEVRTGAYKNFRLGLLLKQMLTLESGALHFPCHTNWTSLHKLHILHKS